MANFEFSAVYGVAEQPSSLQRREKTSTAAGLKARRPQRFAWGNDFEHPPLVLSQTDKSALDQLNQPFGGGQGPCQTPNPHVISKRAVLERTQHELTQVKDIGLASNGEPVGGGSVDRATEDCDQQPADVVGGKTCH